MVGESLTQISASGPQFTDASRPTPVIKIGNPGSTGIAQLSDFIFTVADILPGAVQVEINMAGSKAGDVGLFNCHFRIGGARGSKTSGTGSPCKDPGRCLAARLSLHLTESSSAYVENMWSWTADHDLDGAPGTEDEVYPGTGAGVLVEAQKGTWMLGMGSGEFSSQRRVFG